ncbi:MAG TPA: DUF4411 family protein [Chthoniobacterales bacterium]|nr:DUF4411 family protein [Chthoniobacterales bacterium]
MPYALDANVFIEANKKYYSFKLCPGFWDWLIRSNGKGVVCSHESVLDELVGAGDELSKWAKQSSGFFFPIDAATSAEMAKVSAWVAKNFEPAAVSKFLGVADPLLIAFAMAHGHTVVTEEVYFQHSPKRVKIPEVCIQFKVPCINTFKMLSIEGATFQLK